MNNKKKTQQMKSYKLARSVRHVKSAYLKEEKKNDVKYIHLVFWNTIGQIFKKLLPVKRALQRTPVKLDSDSKR